MAFLELGEVFSGEAVADFQVGLFGLEAEVRQGVHLGTLVPGNLLGYDGIHAFTF